MSPRPVRDAGAMRRTLRPLLALVAAAGATVLLAPAAGAHVEPDVETVPAGGEATVSFVAEHGCDESPTVKVEIQLPDDVADAAAVEKAGWQTDVADGVAVFEWEGVGGDDSGAFGVDFTAPNTPGETLLFPTIQTCTEGSIDWIQEDADGERPAPRVQIAEGGATTTTTAAEGDAPVDETTTTEAATDDSTPTTAAADEATATDDTDDGGGARPFVLAGVVVVIGAIGVFAAAKLRQRQES